DARAREGAARPGAFAPRRHLRAGAYERVAPARAVRAHRAPDARRLSPDGTRATDRLGPGAHAVRALAGPGHLARTVPPELRRRAPRSARPAATGVGACDAARVTPGDRALRARGRAAHVRPHAALAARAAAQGDAVPREGLAGAARAAGRA